MSGAGAAFSLFSVGVALSESGLFPGTKGDLRTGTKRLDECGLLFMLASSVDSAALLSVRDGVSRTPATLWIDAPCEREVCVAASSVWFDRRLRRTTDFFAASG